MWNKYILTSLCAFLLRNRDAVNRRVTNLRPSTPTPDPRPSTLDPRLRPPSVIPIYDPMTLDPRLSTPTPVCDSHLRSSTPPPACDPYLWPSTPTPTHDPRPRPPSASPIYDPHPSNLLTTINIWRIYNKCTGFSNVPQGDLVMAWISSSSLIILIQ